MRQFKTKTKLGIQGDVAFVRVKSIPNRESLEEVKPTGNQIVVTHSETGHNHAFAVGDDVSVLADPNNPLVGYLEVRQPAELQHHRSFNTHETVLFDVGTYRIHRQREHTMDGFRQVTD